MTYSNQTKTILLKVIPLKSLLLKDLLSKDLPPKVKPNGPSMIETFTTFYANQKKMIKIKIKITIIYLKKNYFVLIYLKQKEKGLINDNNTVFPNK